MKCPYCNGQITPLLKIMNDRSLELYDLDNIMYIQAKDKCVTVFSENGERSIANTVKKIFDQHGKWFTQLKYGLIVPTRRIKRINRRPSNKGGYAWIDGYNKPLTISRKHWLELSPKFVERI